MKISPRGRAGGAAPPSVNCEPPHISKTIRHRELKFYAHLDGPSALFGNENISARERLRGAAPLV